MLLALIGPWSDATTQRSYPYCGNTRWAHILLSADGTTASINSKRLYRGSSALASGTGWKDRTSAFFWGLITSPFTIGVYIAIAVWVALLGSAKTGIPAYLLMAAEFLLVIFVDPPKRLAEFRDQRRQSARPGDVRMRVRGASSGSRRYRPTRGRPQSKPHSPFG